MLDGAGNKPGLFFSQLMPLSRVSQPWGLGTTPPPRFFLPGSHQGFKLKFFYSSLPAAFESWRRKKNQKKSPFFPLEWVF